MGLLGESCGHPGALLGTSWWPAGGLGRSLGVEGSTCRFEHPVPSWTVLGASWIVWGSSWALLGLSWGHSG
eukprot:5784675-Pyramimonas_sp.AAC.1